MGVHLANGVDRFPFAGYRTSARLLSVDRAAGRKVWPQDDGAQIVGGDLRVVDQGRRRVDDLAKVMWRDIGGHADRDPGRAVDQQVGQLGGQDLGLFLRAVVVVDEVDCCLVDVRQHLARDRREPRLGVAHRGRRVAVYRAEVALPVHQRVAHREVLRQADEGVVERDVAMRVVLAHHLAHDGRALAVRARGRQAHLAHREQDSAVHGLEAVAHVRESTGDDDAHGVIEIARAHLVLDAHAANPAHVVRHVRATPPIVPILPAGIPVMSGEARASRHR